MVWTKIAANAGMGLEAQHVLRWHNAPVCALKGKPQDWRASLLHKSGISANTIHVGESSLEDAQKMCEMLLVQMGWERPSVGARNGSGN